MEIADIFRNHGPAWRRAMRGHLTHAQLKVMSAIEACRTAELGGYVARCDKCQHTSIHYCSCRNRHCPKCQGSQAQEWLEARKAELLEVPYFHVVFTLPPRIGAIAYQNKAVIYDLLFKASAETLSTIAADPKRLGVRIGFTSVLHTWGSAMTHHPHIHMIVPGGGISLDGALALLRAPKQSRRRQSTQKKVLRELSANGVTIKLLAGRYGPYVTDGTTNASLPKTANPEALTFEQATELLEARRNAAPSGRAVARGGRRSTGGARRPHSATARSGSAASWPTFRAGSSGRTMRPFIWGATTAWPGTGGLASPPRWSGARTRISTAPRPNSSSAGRVTDR